MKRATCSSMRYGNAALAVVVWLPAALAGDGGRGAGLPDAAGGGDEPPYCTRASGYVGVVLAREVVEVTSRLQLTVSSIAVDIGDTVSAGQTVAQLDTRTIRSNLEIARLERDLSRARRDVADKQLATARSRHQRIEALYEKSVESKDELDRAELAEAIAWGEQAIAEGSVRLQEAHVRRLEGQLADGTICAPFAGRVALRYCDPGDLVGPDVPLMRIIGHGRLVRFAVHVADCAQLAEGATLSIYLGARQLLCHGEIERIAPEVDPASGLVFIEARLVDAAPMPGTHAEPLMAGMIVWVRPERAGAISEAPP